MYVGGSIPAVLKQLMRPPAVTLELIFIFFFFLNWSITSQSTNLTYTKDSYVLLSSMLQWWSEHREFMNISIKFTFFKAFLNFKNKWCQAHQTPPLLEHMLILDPT